jgi:hypothetical protein
MMFEEIVERREDGAIVLHLSRESAMTLWEELHMIGEHWAAGAPIVRGSAEDEERLGRILGKLATALDIKRWA